MKLYFRLFFALFLAIGSAQAQYIESQKKEVYVPPQEALRLCGELAGGLKLTTFTTNPPFGWTEHSSRGYYVSKGFGIDLVERIANELNIGTETVGFESDEKMREAFENGNVDIIVGAYYDPKIRALGHFYLVPAFIPNVITVVFMKGKEKKIESFNDLVGLKGAIRQDENLYPYIYHSLPKDLDLKQVYDSREAFTKLLTGEVDFLLSSPYATEAEARRFKLNKQIEMISTPLMGQELFVLYSKNSTCPQFAQEIAQKLDEKRKDLNGLKRTLISFIDRWGRRFKDDPPLIDQLKEQHILPDDFGIEKKQEENP